MRRVTFDVPVNGLATDFTESELPLNFALRFRNRFINKLGGAEKRRGLVQVGNNLPNVGVVDGLHELVDKVGNATLLASVGEEIHRFDDPDWVLVHTMPTVGRLRSVHNRDKLIFWNDTDRPVFTEDAITFTELRALIEVGGGGDETGPTRLNSADITDWSSGTSVAVNDIVFYPTLGSPADAGAYGIITTVSASAVTHTPVSALAAGLGVSLSEPTTNTPFEVIDLVPLNLVDNGVELDNTAVGTSGTSSTEVRVSGVDFSDGEARVGDFVRNTTKVTVSQITTISATALTVTAVSGQTSGDSFVFLKSAMPIPSYIHVHYDRTYYVDSRDQRRVLVSDPYDPQGMTADSGLLSDITFFTGALQPQGDIVLAMESYQSFLAIGGEHNIYLYSGTTPAGTGADFAPVGLFPQGIICKDGMVTLGNEMAFVGHDGVQSIAQSNDASQLVRDQITYPIADQLRDELDAVTSTDEIQLFQYRRRSWMMLKVGSSLYVINYSTKTSDAGITEDAQLRGSISLFDGLIAQGSAYFERRNDNLIIGGAGGKVYRYDTSGVYTDDGAAYSTALQTGWMMLEQPGVKTVTTKAVKYIEPIFEGSPEVVYEITATGGFDFDSSDVINVAASSRSSQVGTAIIPAIIGGSPISSIKHPLRVRGQGIQIQFATDDSFGPDTISRFTLYAAVHGAE
tara:strand:- start:1642 stop:3693 length:2052 start_codon:yes stop_codon:yes gene_type:complete